MNQHSSSPPRPDGVFTRLGQSKLAQLASVVAAIVLASVLVTSTTRAAFSGTTTNAANSVSTGSVTITDDDSGTAMFNNVTGAMPGSNYDRCIQVEYTGSIDPTGVLLYMGAAPTGTLGQYLDLEIDVGAANADVFPDCTSFVSSSNIFTGTIDSFRASHTAWASGLATGWDPSASGQARVFRFRITVQNNDAAQGLSSGFGFTWETQSA